ncbi:MAG: THUMP domain-containing protein [Thermoprotei archaeon]
MDREIAYNAVLVRLGEYMVRYGTRYRDRLISRLRESILRVLTKKGIMGWRVKVIDPRIVLFAESSKENNIDAVELARIISKIFGVSSTSPAIVLEKPSLREVIDTVTEFIADRRARSFRIRIEGEAPYDSPILSGMISSQVLRKTSASVNLSNPELNLAVEYRDQYVFLMDKTYQGVGGLPYGVEGCLAILVSGGIDSALATWYLLKRGIKPVMVYVDMGIYWSIEAKQRVKEFINLINEWIPWDKARMYIASGAENVIASANIPDKLRCIFCKAVMYTIASLVASREKCLGIATGEAVGQVASQTLKNLTALTRLSPLPVYRPVSFMDKIEIIETAKNLGFDKLARKVGTCLLKPEYPETSISEKDIAIIKRELESKKEAIEEIVEKSNVIEF